MTGPIDWEAPLLAAEERLRGRVLRTPLVRSDELSSRLGFPVWLKLESRQRTGSFKYRPALNGLLARRREAVDRGVVASSSGNFAAAVAGAARDEGVAATIVMTPSTSAYKVERTRARGAKVVFCEDRYESRQETVDRIVAETGAVELHPHSSIETLAGDATCAHEIIDDMPEAGSLVLPVSGGGLLGGCALGVARRGARARVFGVQPAGNPAFVRSFESGDRWRNPAVDTVADGLTASSPGELGFAVARDHVRGCGVVAEERVIDAMRWLAFEEKLVVEPAGAVPVAAVMDGVLEDLEPPVVVVISGGNVGAERYARLIAD